MPSLRRRHSDPHSAGNAPLRSALASAALAVEDRVVWGAGDLARGFAELIRWPAQRIAWALENWLIWPLQEETALWSRPTRFAVLAAAVLLAGAALAGGIVLASPSHHEPAPVATVSGPSATRAAPVVGANRAAAAPHGPVLHGSAPNFAARAGAGVPKSGEAEVLHSEPLGAKAAPHAGAGEAGAAYAAKESPTKTTTGNGATPEVAGPAALKVAHEFAAAFVLYEIGTDTPKVKAAIARSTSPDLTKALLRRPPRLPSNVKVPKAKVLNIVPGPVQDGTYTLSVSLLRVGATSELRLNMKQGKGGIWQVTDVLG